MLKNQNPVSIYIPQATRDTFNQIAQATGQQQHQVVAEAAELLRQRAARRAKREGGVQG